MKSITERLQERGKITAYHGSPYSFKRFDLSKVGISEGYGKAKFGHGIYFSTDVQDARKAAEETTLSFHENGHQLYEVELPPKSSLFHWESMMDEGEYVKAADLLREYDEEFSETMLDELESYQETYEWGTFYEMLESSLGSTKEASRFITEDMDYVGCWVESPWYQGTVICIYDDSVIKIVNIAKTP